MRVFSAIISLLLLGACASGSVTKIVTNPPGATVNVPGYGQCETPCTVQVGGRQRITVAKAGFKKRELSIAPGAGRVSLDLELAAPTEGVEAGALPPLD